MSDEDSLFSSVSKLAARIMELQNLATKQYTPVVDDIIRSRCRDMQHIEHTLDGLLDFCGYDRAVELFRRLCRYYYTLDPHATAFYVHAYRDMWDSEETEDTPTELSSTL